MEFEENQDFDSVSRKMLWKESFFENERPAKGLNQRLGWTSLQGSISHMLKPKAAAQRLIALTCLEVVCTTKRNKSNQEGILNQLELISSEARRRWWFRRLGWWFRWGRTVVVGRIKQKKMEIGGEGGWERHIKIIVKFLCEFNLSVFEHSCLHIPFKNSAPYFLGWVERRSGKYCIGEWKQLSEPRFLVLYFLLLFLLIEELNASIRKPTSLVLFFSLLPKLRNACSDIDFELQNNRAQHWSLRNITSWEYKDCYCHSIDFSMFHYSWNRRMIFNWNIIMFIK